MALHSSHDVYISEINFLATKMDKDNIFNN